jgi:hypothetical protein
MRTKLFCHASIAIAALGCAAMVSSGVASADATDDYPIPNRMLKTRRRPHCRGVRQLPSGRYVRLELVGADRYGSDGLSYMEVPVVLRH